MLLLWPPVLRAPLIVCSSWEIDNLRHNLFCSALQASCTTNASVKALRCQLPRKNEFYLFEPDDLSGSDGDASSGVSPCALRDYCLRVALAVTEQCARAGETYAGWGHPCAQGSTKQVGCAKRLGDCVRVFVLYLSRLRACTVALYSNSFESCSSCIQHPGTHHLLCETGCWCTYACAIVA